jgi:hypothetical protein
VYLRDATGHHVPTASPKDIPLPVRAANSRVVHVTELRRQLNISRAATPQAIDITGSAGFAIAVLDPPWRQRFEGTVDNAGTQATSGGFVANLQIAQYVAEDATLEALRNVVTAHGS